MNKHTKSKKTQINLYNLSEWLKVKPNLNEEKEYLINN